MLQSPPSLTALADDFKRGTNMKNRLTDLNDHLFAEMERLGNEDLKGEDLKNEIERADSIARVATQIVQNNNVILKTLKMADDMMDLENSRRMLRLIGGGD